MNIKPAQARQHTDTERKQEQTTSTQPEKGKGFVASDSVETHQKEVDYLKAIGADAVLTDAELEQAAKDEKKGVSLLDLIATGQFVGANNEAIQKAKDKYLNDATPGGLEKVKFDLVADSQKVPADEARNAGITTIKQLMQLKADLELLGEPDSGAVLSNPEIYNRIKEKGLDGVLAEAAIKNMGLSDAAKGLSLKQVLNGAAKAQKKGQDASKAEYWDKIKKGQGRHAGAGHAREKGKPDGRVDHTPGDHDRPTSKPTDNRQRGTFIEEPIHHAKPGGGHHRGDSALSPFARKKGEEAAHTNTPPQQHHDSSKTSQTRHGSQTDRNWQRDTDPATRSHRPKESTHGGGAPQGNPTGNSAQGSDSTNAPTQGTNPTGGAANDHSGQAGSERQTGVGVSAASGGQEAHGGAVNTATGVHHGMDGTTTFYWTRSGGGDGQDGHYRTVYDGHGGFMVFNEDTEELVNQGVGDPPTDAIAGNSQQDEDQNDDMMSFPVTQQTDGTDDDNDTTATDADAGTEGMPIDPMIGNFGDSDGVLSPWEIGVHVSRTDQLIHTTGSSSGARPIGSKKGEPNDGVTDPGSDMQSHRAGGSKKFRRSDGYTDGSPGQTEGHKPATAGNQPKQPSHAKHQSSLHRTRRSGH